MLEALTGIRRSPTQVRRFLAHLGLHRWVVFQICTSTVIYAMLTLSFERRL
jgi:hypothetical protein